VVRPLRARRRLSREESRAETRQRLIAAGRKIFLRRGFHAATIEEIAEEAGYTIGALYSNFETKGDLFVAVFEDYAAVRAAEVERAVDAAGDADARPAAAAAQWMDKLAAEPQWFPVWVEFWAYAVHHPLLRKKFAVPLGALRVTIGRLVERRASERGFALPMPAEDIGLAIKALGEGVALEKLIDPDAVPDSLLGNFLAIFFRGLEASGESPDHGIRSRDRPKKSRR
jgi:AcrR family transcriptional regulator